MLIRLLVLVAIGATAWSGCGAQPTQPVHVDASITQFRFDEGTNRLRVAVVNQGDRSIRVTPAAGLTARIDGHDTTMPLRVEDAGLLVRLHQSACAAADLDKTATITLRLGDHLQGEPGARVLPARVVVRRTSPGDPLRLVSLGGSVLIILNPAGNPKPATVASFTAPIEISVRDRCDGHARSQSSQTFLLSAFVRLGSRPVQRVVLPLTAADLIRLNDLLDKECA